MSRRQHGCWTAAWGTVIVLCAAAALSAGEIRIWPTAAVEGDGVRLGDVAEVRGLDAPTAERLRGITVSASPKAGGNLIIQAGDVRGALAEASVNLAELNLLGSAKCKVTRLRPATAKVEVKQPSMPTRRLPVTARAKAKADQPGPSSTTMESVLREFIVARVGEPEGKVEVRFSPTARHDLALDASKTHFDIRPRDDGKLGLLTFEVDIRGEQAAPRSVPIVAEVSLSREVVVARRAINRGETIEGRHLKLEQRRFTDFSQIGVTDLAAVAGQQARQLIRNGEMLADRCVESRPVVRRGDPVTIWMRQGGLVIKAGGRAQASGSLGERIEVARDGMKRKQDLIDVVVTGPGTVAVNDGSQVALARGE